MFYAVVWMVGSVITFVWAETFWTVLASALVYPVFWLAAEWDAHFLDVIMVVSGKTRRTKNRDQWGADSYEP